MDHDRIAMDIKHEVGDVAGDVAFDMMNMEGYESYMSPDWDEAISKAKKSGVQNISGWFADWLYDNPDFLEGHIGDKVYDKSKGVPNDAIKILESMKEHAHPGLRIACDKMIKRWEERR